MSSLAPRNILQGAHWNYRILDRVKGDNTHISNVFKAEVIPRENPHNASKPPRWAFMKGVLPEDPTAMLNLERELHAYRLPGVASTQCFRKMYDVIDNNAIALEWLDTTLAELKYHPNDIGTHPLIVSVLRAALSSCAVLEDSKYVNTDYKPANILLSGIGSDCITAKVGDLGLVVPVDHLYNAQPYAMRAPEVFLGQACTEPSQVWAVAAMLLCWIKPGVLGMWGSYHPLINVPWSMAKVKRLFPDWNIPTPDEDLLRFMLIPDPVETPSALSVLASRELQAFENLMGA
ncbi:hypothetical protein LT330_003569 [Penicillium expansum]|nr:hypothetical protein LT330_003569 [Penicillium expansum]